MNEHTGNAEAIITEAASKASLFYPAGLRPVGIRDLLSLKIPPREMVLGPIIPTQGIVQLYSIRGLGKTYFGLGAGYAVATGGTFLRYEAPKPRRVLYIDGEMPAVTMQERIAAIVAGAEHEPEAAYFQIITPDLQDAPIPNLSGPETQKMVEAIIEHEGYELIIIDNLSALCDFGKENESDSWRPMQDFALALRRKGRSVLFVHHAGKNGTQRGTSKKEDLLDTVVKLQRPADYRPSDGARFEIHLEKARGVFGEDAAPFEAQLQTVDGAAVWTMRSAEDSDLAQLAALLNDGESIREAAKEMGISKSKAERMKQKAVEKGLLREIVAASDPVPLSHP